MAQVAQPASSKGTKTQTKGKAAKVSPMVAEDDPLMKTAEGNYGEYKKVIQDFTPKQKEELRTLLYPRYCTPLIQEAYERGSKPGEIARETLCRSIGPGANPPVTVQQSKSTDQGGQNKGAANSSTPKKNSNTHSMSAGDALEAAKKASGASDTKKK